MEENKNKTQNPKVTETPEQRDIIAHDYGDIMVSASAGSGKTHTMILRIVRLLTERKASIKQILAVTFTEASASDMKEKLKGALAKKINEGLDFLSSELVEVAGADISTIHAFCARLLRQYFFAVGISPDFKIADEDQALTLRTESINKTFKEFYASGDVDFCTLIDRYRKFRSDGNFKNYILQAYNYVLSEKNYEEFKNRCLENYSEGGFDGLKAEYKKYLNKSLASIIVRLNRAIEGFNEMGNAPAQQFCTEVLERAQSLLDADLYAIKDYKGIGFRANFGRKLDEEGLYYKSLGSSAYKDFKELIEEYDGYLCDERTDREGFSVLRAHTTAFFKVLDRFMQHYASLKREENLMDFGDLEHFALSALRDESVRKAVKEKYKFIFVDEYQDVNGVQDEILSLISSDNTFMVGDLKQSIYGFRGCRSEFFWEKWKKMSENGQITRELNKNFRSSKAVVNTVNEIFSFCMTEEFSGIDYLKSKLIYGGLYAEGFDGRSTLHFLSGGAKSSRQKEEPRIYDVMEELQKAEQNEECSAISTLIAKIIREELGKTYFDDKEQKEKQVTFSDIVILARNRDNKYISDLVSGLIKQNLPISSEVKENVCDYPEIKTLIHALRLVDCFRQDVSLVATMKSPIGDFSEEDLSEIALYYSDNFKCNQELHGTRGGFSDAFFYYIENAETPLKDRLVEFVNYFNKVRYISDFIGASGTLKMLTEDCDYENYLLCSQGGDGKVRRLFGFIATAETAGKILTVREFIKKIDSAKDAFKIPPTADENTVKVMTIHASKGLEFPVVIVCGLERTANTRDEREETLKDRRYGFGVRLYDDEYRTVKETLLRGVMVAKKKEELVKEEMLLFYVATTRAKYSLHLTFEGKEDGRSDFFVGAKRFWDYIPKSIRATDHDAERIVLDNLKKERRQILIGRADETEEKAMRENFAFKYPFLSDTVLPLKNTVTSATRELSDKLYITEPKESEIPRETDVERGITAHKILQYLDFGRLNEFDKMISEMMNCGIIDKVQVEKLDIARVERAVKGGELGEIKDYRLYREKDFILEIQADKVFKTDSKEKVLLQGVIDLLAIKDGRAVVVDYKFSSLNADNLRLKYKLQLDLYAYAVQKLLGVKVDKKIILNLYTGESVRVD